MSVYFSKARRRGRWVMMAGALNMPLRQYVNMAASLNTPKGSHAWKIFGLPVPKTEGGWTEPDEFGGRSCCVEQGRYGHYARKPTWLYAVDIDFQELDWGVSESRLDPATVERMGLKRAKKLGEVGAKGGGKDSPQRIGTPIPFRDLLISMVMA